MDRRFIIFLLLVFTTLDTQSQIIKEKFFTRKPDVSLAPTRNGLFNQLTTPWADSIDTDNVLGEYPRPIMQRDEWLNLNGYWDFALCDSGAVCPEVFEKQILVPYPVESYLSGIQDSVFHNNEVWYHRTFEVPENWKGKHILLNFGAVDWRADVWVNDTHLVCHEGGYTAFSVDITSALIDAKEQDIKVRVWDPSDEGYQPCGKQCIHPGTIWYTASTGIWQTVWLEPVKEEHIRRLVTIPDLDNGKVKMFAHTEGDTDDCDISVNVLFDDKVVASATGKANDSLFIVMPEGFYTWTPDNPWLYDLDIKLKRGDEILDDVDSYTAMRKFSSGKDKSGRKVLLVNDEQVFQFGPLDQGYWPDGLYTAPTDEAIFFDIQQTKLCGFNMTRKHLKVEPARWYTYCDRVGLLVWQDMPSGDEDITVDNKLPTKTDYCRRSQESIDNYMRELQEVMDQLMSYPCICTWVLFNEGMGQFNTKEVAQWAKAYDPTRWIDAASGGNFYYTGDILDSHHYPSPFISFSQRNYATVIGEYGGLGLTVPGHVWDDNTWSYKEYDNSTQLRHYYDVYTSYFYSLKLQGLSAAVYTQLTDVENETNGLMTYDRKVMKIDRDWLYNFNQMVMNMRFSTMEIADNK